MADKQIKILFLLFLLFILFTAAVFSAETVNLKNIKGFIEIKAPGKGWETALEGQVLDKGTLISAGFNSSALIDTGYSEILIKPLTKLAFDDLSILSSSIKSAFSLQIGRIKCSINIAEGYFHDFTLTTPFSAINTENSVFEAGTDSIRVIEGKASYTNTRGQKVSLPGGVSSSAAATGITPPLSALTAVEAFSVKASTSPAEGTGVKTDQESAGITGSLTIVIENM